MSQAVQESKSIFTPSKIIHIVIGLSIMFFLPFLGSPEFVVTSSQKLLDLGFPTVEGGVKVFFSPIGMQILCLFLGMIYLWTTVDTVWPGFLAVFMLGASDFGKMEQVLSLYMGNPTVVYILTMFMFCAVIIRSQISVYLARYLMTRPFATGRPWVLTALVLFTTFCVGFIESTTAVFIMWPVIYVIFKECGYKKGDKYTSFMVVGVAYMALLSFATDAIKGGAFYLVLSIGQLAENPAFNITPMPLVSYLLMGLAVSFVSMAIFLVLMRFVYKVDVSQLASFDVEILKANPLPPMTWKQKTIIVLFALFAFWLLGAGVIPTTTVLGAFLAKTKMGVCVFILFLLFLINRNGEPLTDFPTMAGGTAWVVFFIIAAAFLFGGVLSNPVTNFNVVIESVFKDFFQGFSYTQLIIGVVLLAIVITNFTNSVVAGLIFAPILIPLCNVFGYPALPLLACFFYTVLIALCTPAGSPFAALLFGNSDWISVGDAAHYSIVASLISVVTVLCVGLPLALILI